MGWVWAIIRHMSDDAIVGPVQLGLTGPTSLEIMSACLLHVRWMSTDTWPPLTYPPFTARILSKDLWLTGQTGQKRSDVTGLQLPQRFLTCQASFFTTGEHSKIKGREETWAQVLPRQWIIKETSNVGRKRLCGLEENFQYHTIAYNA